MKEQRYNSGNVPQIRLEERAEGQLPTLVGYGAVFYNPNDPGTEYDLRDSWGGFVERVMPGSFDRALREDDVRGLFNHDPNEILGRTSSGTMRLSVDRTGLRYEIDPPNTPDGQRVVEAVRRGDVDGSSFSFSVRGQVWRDVSNETGDQMTTYREITDVALYDVGPVAFPAYKSSTAGVRSEDDVKEGRKALDDWRTQKKQDAAAADLDMAEASARCVELDLQSANLTTM